MLPFDRMLPLTGEEIESYKNQRFCYICRRQFYDVGDGNEKMILSDGNGSDEEFDPKNI